MTDLARGKNISLLAAVFQAVFSAVMLTVWLWVGSKAALSACLFLVGGVFLWLFVAMMFYVRQLARQEQMASEELAAQGAESTIFEQEAAGRAAPAAAREAFFETWVVPAFTLVWAAFHATCGILIFKSLMASEVQQLNFPAHASIFLFVIGFLGFLLSRYTTGMARQAQWRLLRGPSGYLLTCVVWGIIPAIFALIFAWQNYPQADRIAAIFVPVAQLILAGELVINFILDLYRPRVPGKDYHVSFDSRLMDLLAEPQRVGTSVAETLNYQFGFEVSKTWFYELLSRALLPLLIFGVVSLMAMSCLVIVQSGQQCVLMHWGKAADEPLDPGIHVKWPWPIDVVHRLDVGQIYEIILGQEGDDEDFDQGNQADDGHGHDTEESPKVRSKPKQEVLLWTEDHAHDDGRKEMDFLIAIPTKHDLGQVDQGEQPPPPVNIIKLVVGVQYSIEDIHKFAFQYTNAGRLLQSAAYRELTRFGASATLTEHVIGENRPEAIMTFGREKAASDLRDRIQNAVGPDGLDLGVKITSVNFHAVHPPKETAEAYELVLEEERRQGVTRFEAQAQANNILAKVGGNPAKALHLALAIQSLEQLEALVSLGDRPEQFVRQLQEYIGNIGQQISIVDRGIRREHILGKADKDEPGADTDEIRLRNALQAHQNLLRKIQTASKDGTKLDLSTEIALATELAESLLDGAGGGVAVALAEAQSYRWDKELSERGRADAFDREILAYDANPQIYMLDRWLDVWDEVLPNVTKYVIGVDRDKVEVWLNLEQGADTIESTLTNPQDQ